MTESPISKTTARWIARSIAGSFCLLVLYFLYWLYFDNPPFWAKNPNVFSYMLQILLLFIGSFLFLFFAAAPLIKFSVKCVSWVIRNLK